MRIREDGVKKEAHGKWPVGRVYINGLIMLLYLLFGSRAHMLGYCLPVAETLQRYTFQQQQLPVITGISTPGMTRGENATHSSAPQSSENIGYE